MHCYRCDSYSEHLPPRNLRKCRRIHASSSADGPSIRTHFGVRIGGFGNPQSDETIIRINGRAHLSKTDVIPDIRRNNLPLGSLAQFWAKTPLMLRGLGFSRGCDLQEAILTVADLFLISHRIVCLSTFATCLPIESSDLSPNDTDSSPSWMDRHSDDEEQN